MIFPKSLAILLYSCVVNVALAQGLDCLLSSQMVDIPAQNLAYALQNITCPVTTGANQLLDNNNVSSIIEYSNDIVVTLSDTITYLKANAPNGSVTSAQTDLFRGPILGVPFEFGSWTNELVANKQAIMQQNLANPLLSSLMQQRTGLQEFVNLVVAVAASDLKADASGNLMPALNQLDCAIGVFQSQSSATICSGSGAPTTMASTVTSVATLFSVSATTTGTSSTSISSATGSTISPTSTHSGADSKSGVAIEMFLGALLCGFGIF